ncbi:MAG: L-seryl-tRNA(Sec) selenium transferase [Candidatus Sericytochromatia bacterium]|nr:L-seryl-tRNA(Sec) selenium transferase [Candidatus Sericytochromatia bacterium]
MPNSDRRHLPAVHRLVSDPGLSEAVAALPAAIVTSHVRQALADARAAAAGGGSVPDTASLVASVRQALDPLLTVRLRQVINATGIVLNTNLGRAPLPRAAVDALVTAASGYSNLEYDLATGERGSRHDHLAPLITALTGAEAALVVNNNAAAVLLVASAFASGREIIVSRGQLIEIGGSFRLPDVIAMSGARLVEVGTTNKTYASDYVRALTPETGLLMRSHTSNYRIAGFTADVSPAALALIGREHGIPTCEDLGSGQLLDLTGYGLPHEPTVGESLSAGLDLVTFSGDKLLGGPQAGIIAGRRSAIDPLRRHPLLRALRPDKLTLAALASTLTLYLSPDVITTVPTVRMLTLSADVLAETATHLAALLCETVGDRATITVQAATSQAGGGSWPGTELPTTIVAIAPVTLSVTKLAKRLRAGRLPVIGRIQSDQLWLDPRTLMAGDVAALPALVAEALG